MRFGTGVRVVLISVSLATALTACGYVDPNVTFVPAKWRQPAPGGPPVDPEPDVKKLVADNLTLVFAGHATDVRVGPPHRDGMHWQACVTATVLGMAGAPQPIHLLLSIEEGKIGDRTRITAQHWCAADLLDPI